jgi:alkylated DNA nucleotide flippase Atl1
MLRTEGFDGPWWRVVGSKGDLPIDRRGPHYGLEQRRQLAAEGVLLKDDRIPEEFFVRY